MALTTRRQRFVGRVMKLKLGGSKRSTPTTISGGPSSPLSRSGCTACVPIAACPRERRAPGHSVLPRIDKECDDGFFAKRLGGLQPVQTLNKHETRAVRPY